MKKKDTIYRKKKEKVPPFTFDEEVALSFDDMAERSIPGYENLQHLIADIALSFYQADSVIYDIGCSTGNTVKAVQDAFRSRGNRPLPRIMASDNSAEMLTIAREKIPEHSVKWICQPVQELHYRDASVVIAAYVLQFIDPSIREGVIKDIYDGLKPGGVFVLAEKVCCVNDTLQEIITKRYHDFKRSMGYSDMEIEQKDRALENVLRPLTLETYIFILKKTGFSIVETFFRQYNFTCIMAVK